MSDGITVRPAVGADRPAVLELLTAALGWVPGAHHSPFFSWKHDENPFGPSPAWLALDGDLIVGVRTFLRWEFVAGRGEPVRAVRAVDTATHPDHQGRGIFRLLTMHALDELRAEGVGFVFNTPNDQSRPGYLKMGWEDVGRLRAAVRPRSIASGLRMLRARTPASKWSLPTEAGQPASAALDDPAIDDLLASQPPTDGLRTHRTPSHLRWRYRFEPLHYRALVGPGGPGEGIAVFRLRQRGAAVEAALAMVLARDGDPTVARRLVTTVAATVDADYVIGLRRDTALRARFLPLPGQGPRLTWRSVISETRPARDGWRLSLGDVELF